MKRTELERYDREVRRIRKKEDNLQRRSMRESNSVGDYINELSELFFHDGTRIYNINDSAEILELLEEIKENIPTNKWSSVLRKAIKKTNIGEKEEAFQALRELGDMQELAG